METPKLARYALAMLCALAGCAVDPNAEQDDDGGPGAGDPVGVVAEPIIGGVAATEYPEAAIVNMPVSATSMYLCSATLIAPRVILTAGHCVDGFTAFDVYVGATMRTATSAVTYDWAEHGATTVNPLHHDLGLIFLDAPITLASYPSLASAPLADGSRVTDVGRIHNGTPTSTAWEAGTTVYNAASSGYPYDYMASVVIEHGDSGGPVFAAGTHTIVAVNSGAGGGTEVLARVDLLRDWIDAQVNAHGGYAGAAAADAGADARVDGAGADARVDAGGDVRSDAAADARADAGTDVRADAGADVRVDAATDVRVDAATDVRADVRADVPPDVRADVPPDVRADAGTTCATASSPNTLARANTLGSCVRGALTTSVYSAYFVFTPVSGVAYTLTLTPTGNARYTLGVVTPSGATSLCVPLVTNQLSTRVTVTGVVRGLCVQVTSATHAAQSYTLTRM